MAALTQQLSGPDFERMLETLRQISAEPTLDQIREVMVRFGITSPKAKDGKTPSREAATTLRDGPFARYIERLNAGREMREQLVTAAGAGVHPLDAIEEAMVCELQDHLVAAEGGVIDIKFVCDRVEQLRGSISQRENSRRQQADLVRKNKETEAKLSMAEQREKMLAEQIQKLERDRLTWEAKQRAVAEQLERAKNASTEDADKIRANVVDTIDSIMGLKK